MAWLAINGITFPILDESTSEGDDTPRTQGRSVNGVAFSNAVGSERSWTFTVKLDGLTEQRALNRLLRDGENGHVWDAEGATDAESKFSSKGLEFVVPGNISQSADQKFGSSGYTLDSLSARIIDLSNLTAWTVAAWHTTDTWSTDTHYIQTSDDHRFVDGSRNDSASLPWTSTQTSTATPGWDLTDDSTGARYDDLLFFPFVWPDRWATEFDLTTAHSLLPELTLTGDFYDRTPVDVLVQDQSVINYRGTASGTKGAVEFSVREVGG